jgi:anti-anti-sigma factor
VSLIVRVIESRPFSKTVYLEGRLNNETVPKLDDELNRVVNSTATVVVFDLSELDYISSAGLRSIFRLQKAVAERSGKTVLVNPQPQIRKVLEIVRATDLAAVFTSVEELDRYLDAMQRKVIEGE